MVNFSGSKNMVSFSSIALAIALLGASIGSHAQTFPSKPIRLIQGFATGGAIDSVLRVLAVQVERELGQPVVMDYKLGAGGTVSIMQLKNSLPDGYTLALITKGAFRAPAVEDVAYDPAKDLSYIVGIADIPFGIVVLGDAPWKTLPEMIQYGRANPLEMNYGATGGWGNSAHLYMEALTAEAGVKWNPIPYNGSPDGDRALLGNQIKFSVNGSIGGGLLESGRLRLLAVASKQRSSLWPNVPSSTEFGYKSVIESLWGLGGPRGVPPAVARRIQDAFRNALNTPEAKTILQRFGQNSNYMSTEDFTRFAMRSIEEEAAIVKKFGLGKKP